MARYSDTRIHVLRETHLHIDFHQLNFNAGASL